MSVLPLNDDHTARDFLALRERYRRDARSVFPGWTEFDEAKFDTILMDHLCGIGDKLDVYGAARRREGFLALCVERPSAIRLTRVLGYTMRGATAALVDLEFTLSKAYAGDVTFPAGSIVSSESATDPVRVQLLDDLTILAGNLSGTVSAENSTTPSPDYFQSDGAADQEFTLSQTPYLEIVSVEAVNGTYGPASNNNFLDSLPTDRHYVVLVSAENRATIRTGDGRNGQPPSEGQVAITYKVGGGGIVIDPNTLKVARSSVQDSLGNPVVFTVTNPLASTAGLPAETIEEARLNAPASLRVGERSVAREDYEINARRISGVARALMLTSDQYAPIAENSGQLHTVALGAQTSTGYYGPATPTTTQLEQIKATILTDYPPTATFDFDVLAATFKTINIASSVWLESGTNPATVDAAIRLRFAEFFAVSNPDGTPTETEFGYNVKDELGDPEPLVSWGDLFAVVKNTPGVRRVDEDGFSPADAVTLLVYEWPRLGTITLLNARTGQPLVP